ncbi:MAG: glycosyltransferase, partial [Gammaproteobacteria bacterium]
NEGLPMAILEAMAAGLAVIATPVGGIPEAVLDEHTGALVAPGDAQALAMAVRRVLQEPALAVRWGEAGRERIEQHFSPAASEAALMALWQQVAR